MSKRWTVLLEMARVGALLLLLNGASVGLATLLAMTFPLS
jgi:hypothetical protein